MELYSQVVYSCGISPDYFFDYMTDKEVAALINKCNEEYRNEWERTRWLGYIIAISNGAKLNSPTDLVKFDWDTKTLAKIDNRTTKEIEAIKREMIKSKTTQIAK